MLLSVNQTNKTQTQDNMKLKDSITFQHQFKLKGIWELAFMAAMKLLSEIKELESFGCSAQWEVYTYKKICKRFCVGDACAAANACDLFNS